MAQLTRPPDSLRVTVDRPVDDEQLIARLAGGDEAALAALYDRYAGALFTLLVRTVDDRPIAEELLQEAFLRAWRHAGTYAAERGRVHSWLLGIAHHLALSELRRRQRRPRMAHGGERGDLDSALAALPDPAPDLDETTWISTRRAQLARALADLPQAERAAVALYAHGYSQSEIAARLGAPLGTVKTRLRRGFQGLRATLQAAGFDGE